MKQRDNATVCFSFYIFAAVLTLVIFFATFSTEKKGPAPVPFVDNWYYDTDMTSKADLKHPVIEGVQVSFYAFLPEYVAMGDCLWFKFKNGHYTVSIDGKIRAENITSEYSALYGKTTGTDWACVPLEQDDAGKIITISFMPCYEDNSAYLDEMYIGSAVNTLRNAVAERFFGTVLCVLIMFLGTVMVIIYLVMSSMIKGLPKELLYLGTFSFFTALWSLSELRIMQIFTEKNAGIFHNLTCMSLMLIAMPLFLYYKEDLDRRSKWITPSMTLITVLNFTICCVFHFYGLYDFHETLTATHITLGGGALVITYANYLRIFRNPDRTIGDIPPAIAIVLMMVAGIVDIIRYSGGGINDTSFFTRIALFFYVVALGIKSLSYIIEMVKKGMKSDIVSKLAYEDGLTGLGNRTAYEEKIDEVKEEELTIFMFDINNLKYVNDHFGHQAGDELIMAGADMITIVFGRIGSCYRIGGDEFTCVANKLVNGEEYAKEFSRKLDAFNHAEPFDFPLVIAVGHADHKKEDDIKTVIETADYKMYENKKELKINEGTKYARKDQ